MSEAEYERSEPEEVKDLLGGPVRERKVRKQRSSPRFMLFSVIHDSASGSDEEKTFFMPVDTGKSRQDCEKKALTKPDGRYAVLCLHSELDIKSETVKMATRVKA